MSASWRGLLLPLLAGCACPPSPPDAGFTGLRGDFIQRSLLANGGVALQPERLSGRTLTAYVEQADGTFQSYPGAGADDGTFTVPGLPEGPFTLQLGDLTVHTEGRTLHLGANVLGRPGVFSAARGEGVQLTAGNLAPWAAGDELQFTSWNAGLGSYSTATKRSPAFATGAPDAGATSLLDAFVDFEDQPVVDAAQGDDFTITQLESRGLDGGLTAHALSRVLRPAVTLAIGAPTPVSGQFDAVPPARATVRFEVSAFVGYGPQVNAAATPFQARALIDAHPGPFGATTFSGDTPDLAVLEAPVDGGDPVVELAYGNPFGPSWTPYVASGVLFEVRYRAPFPDGALANARAEVGFVSSNALFGPGTSQPLRPLISPPRAVTVDGQPAAAPLEGVGPTPVVAWTAPALGTVARTELEAVELAADLQVTRRRSSSRVRVIGPRTSLRLPPGMLNPGRYYFLRLTAFTEPSTYDPASPLIDVGPPAGAACTLTALFHTSG